jgi:hypothetical protein
MASWPRSPPARQMRVRRRRAMLGRPGGAADNPNVARLSQKRVVVAGGGFAPWRPRVAGRVVWRAWPRRGPFRPVR